MATPGRRPARSLEHWLFAHSNRFNVYQLVRLLRWRDSVAQQRGAGAGTLTPETEVSAAADAPDAPDAREADTGPDTGAPPFSAATFSIEPGQMPALALPDGPALPDATPLGTTAAATAATVATLAAVLPVLGPASAAAATTAAASAAASAAGVAGLAPPRLLAHALRYRLRSGPTASRSLHGLGFRLRFKADLSAGFPGHEVTQCRVLPPHRAAGANARGEGLDEEVVEIRTPNYCIASELGPLPETFVEWMRDLQRTGNATLVEFLDLFNHRFNMLRHQLKATQDVALNFVHPDDSLQADFLSALMGLAQPSLEQQIPLPRRAWLGMAPMLADTRHSAASALQALRLYMGQQVVLEPLVGAWCEIAAVDWTQLGRRNHRLGHSTVLGRRVWDQQAGIGLSVDGLSYERLCALLPGGGPQPDGSNPYDALVAMVRLLFDRRVDCHMRLAVRTETLPRAVLAARPERVQAQAFAQTDAAAAGAPVASDAAAADAAFAATQAAAAGAPVAGAATAAPAYTASAAAAPYAGLRLGRTAWLGRRPSAAAPGRVVTYTIPAYDCGSMA
jgi:type VI secretion system protein ImpH